MSKAKHIYRTTREVQNTITFQDAFGQHVPSHNVTITTRATSYVFRGGSRAFQAHLEALNAEHGAGYAVAA